MKSLSRGCLALALATGCAAEDAYLTLDVSFPEQAQGKYGHIVLRRNSGPPIADGPFEITSGHLRRRIAVHARGHELDAELELGLWLCSSRQTASCDQTSTLQLQNAFDAGHTTALCVTFEELARGRWPESVDVARTATFPDGFRLCEAP